MNSTKKLRSTVSGKPCLRYIRNLPLLFILGFMLASLLVHAGTNPSIPSNITVDANTTISYPNGTMLNKTRGYIFNLTINESQPTQKWLGFVGNINGEFALQNAAGSALYDWDIVTITGELYATRETGCTEEGGAGPTGGPYDADKAHCGGIPNWSNLWCVNSSHITTEETHFNHTSSDEDSFSNTFTNGTLFNLSETLYAGERNVTDTLVYGDGAGLGTCYGTYLNVNDSTQYTNWTEVVLTDGSYQFLNSSENNDEAKLDIIYAVFLENDTIGYDDNNYDFQILLPTNGTAGLVDKIAFYFYIELI